MKILIDAHMVGERESGNERYIFNLLRALHSLELPAEFLIAGTAPELFEGLFQRLGRWRFVQVSSSPWRRLFVELPRLVRAEGVSLLHVTYAGPIQCDCPVISTVHDISYLPHPEWFSLKDRLVLRCGVGVTLSRGAAVITVSDYSKNEIMKHYRLPEDRIHVTKEAADPRFRLLRPDEAGRDRLAEMGVRFPYILAVGNLQPRKNLTRLVQAFVRLRQESGISHQLVLAGKAQWRESELYEVVRCAGIEQDVLFTGHISDNELVRLYNAADVFVYPSLYEGFGLPVLEAMACGVPVVTSCITSIPEVAGEAALLCDPCDVDALAMAIGRILQDRNLNNDLRINGLRHAASFSWEKTAKLTWESYCAVAAGGAL
jgi:glycosyltransferase involved in cell wall biosynthesis